MLKRLDDLKWPTADQVPAVLDATLTQGARQAPPLRAGKDSADGIAVLGYQCGVCCCSMYWRTMEIGAPPQDEAK